MTQSLAGGGGEFVAILPGINVAVLALVAERVRAAVEGSFMVLGGERLGVTISMGGAMVEVGDGAAGIIARADAQMYRSKACGRDMFSFC